MRLLSWNVQGLGGAHCKKYKGRLWQDLNKCMVGGGLNIMMVQEHHLSDDRIRNYGSILKGKWQLYWSSVIGERQRKAGVCIAVVEKQMKNVVQYMEVIPRRAQCLVMRVEDEDVAFLNVYTPNYVSAKGDFWTELCLKLPNVNNWCVAGDSNMIENVEDRIGGSNVVVHRYELVEWEKLCIKLRMQDVWSLHNFVRMSNSLLFSRSDRKMMGSNLSRIDRIYVNDFMGGIGA